jgi:hypothetical protein
MSLVRAPAAAGKLRHHPHNAPAQQRRFDFYERARQSQPLWSCQKCIKHCGRTVALIFGLPGAASKNG